MTLQVTSRDGAVERRILIAMITNKSVLGRIAARWDGKLFRTQVSNQLASLCIDFYHKHADAPNKAIDSLYESWSESHRDPNRADDIGRFLQELGGEYKQLARDVNPEHVIDIAGKHFREVRQEQLRDDLERYLTINDHDRVDKLIDSYRKMDLGVGAGINLFNDEEEVQSLFANEDEAEVLVRYPGALGEFFSFDLARDCFVVFLGSAKSTKSFWIQDIAWRALCSRRRVAYFEAGDLSKKQVERRFLVRAALHPYRSVNTRPPFWPCTIDYPVEMEVQDHPKNGRRRGVVTKTREKIYDDPLTYEMAKRACDKVMKKVVRSRQPYFKLSVHANSTLTVDSIRSTLDGYALDDWYADVIVIDYSDIMAYPAGAKDERDAINTTWKQLRRLSQEYHCLVVTATQADADAYNQEILSKKNFSGDRRKNDHVTAMYGINLTDEEKERKVCRLNLVARREGECVTSRCVHVAQCLALGQPAVLSSF